MILHVDMDAFFASVEQLDNPELRGKCVIVGGLSDRGVVSAASYAARKFGVRSAMPMYRARQLCPQGVFVFPRHHRYKEVSAIVMSVLKSFSPLVEPVSIDEAFMDITGCEHLFGGPVEMGKALKQRITETVHLTCSVGIAPLKFLAKIASDMDKPDGLTFISADRVPAFIETLPIGKVPGVGRVTNDTLDRMGVKTLGDVQKIPAERLLRKLGKYGHRLIELSHGVDRSAVSASRAVKSISSEETLAADTRDRRLIDRLLLKHAEDVGRQLRKKGGRAKTVFIKIKHADFTSATRQHKLPQYTCASEAIYRSARQLMDAYILTKPIRLIGLGVTDLEDRAIPRQMELFSEMKTDDRKWERIDGAVDAIVDKFGRDAIKKAGLWDKDGE